MALSHPDKAAEKCKALAEAYAKGELIADSEFDYLRSNLAPEQWLVLCRTREAAITAKSAPTSPYPEASIVRLRAGGPLMTVEAVREHEKLVQCVWLDALGRVQRDAFHKDALEEMPRPASKYGEAEFTAAALDMVACEIYRALLDSAENRIARPAWQSLGEDARDIYRACARAAWTAIAELHT